MMPAAMTAIARQVLRRSWFTRAEIAVPLYPEQLLLVRLGVHLYPCPLCACPVPEPGLGADVFSLKCQPATVFVGPSWNPTQTRVYRGVL